MIDEFRGFTQEAEFDPFSVILFKALQAIAFLFCISLLIIAPQDKKGKVDSKAEFMISMNWPDNSPEDLDLFVQDPLGNVAWYRRREAGFMVLERDNRGGINNFIMVNGEKVLSPIRQELVSIRGIVAGEYTVNAYNFLTQNPAPLSVTVTVEKLNPKVTIVSKETITLDHGGHEKTAVRFTIDAQGNVTGTTKEDRSILQTFYDPNRNAMVE